tara:strand:- start:151 stop:741 length:591 start_codon:yes stop_codon:yes gene_type:complete
MANHVTTFVRFNNINDAATQKLKDLLSPLTKDDSNFAKIYRLPVEETNTREWYVNNVGAKWCIFDDYDDVGFNLTSAWSFPEDGIKWIINKLAEVQSDIITEVRYEDEMPNFFGVRVYKGDPLGDNPIEYGEDEDDIEEIRNQLNLLHPDLLEEWDDDEEEYSEDGQELYYEYIYDFMNDCRDDTIEHFIFYMKDE